MLGPKPQGDWTAKSDDTLALEWPIDDNAIVWEIGGFEGRWAAQMAAKFDPRLFVFEPQPWAFERLCVRFRLNEKVKLYPYGLWVADADLPLGRFETDGASLIDRRPPNSVCNFRDIYTVFQEILGVGNRINVCLMNIEGAEFSLIPYMLAYGLFDHIDYFWCQFHTFVKDSDKKIKAIYNGLSRTHEVLWDYYPTAVAWK